jgi:hypothetical protein
MPEVADDLTGGTRVKESTAAAGSTAEEMGIVNSNESFPCSAGGRSSGPRWVWGGGQTAGAHVPFM